MRSVEIPTTAQRACGKQSHLRFAGNELSMRHLHLHDLPSKSCRCCFAATRLAHRPLQGNDESKGVFEMICGDILPVLL
jgi:hypothetical protein